MKHIVIRTPLEEPVAMLRKLASMPHRLCHPELRALYQQPAFQQALLRKILDKDSNCIDVGAHLGSFVSRLLKQAPSGQHIAFEPIPRKASWLRAKFPEVRVEAICLSNEKGVVAFHENLSRSGYSGLSGGRFKTADRVRTVQVPTACLDDILSPEHRVDFIKIDVEGAETRVLAGAAGTLRRWLPPVLFECTLTGMKNYGLNAEHVWNQVCAIEPYAIFLVEDYMSGREPLTSAAFDGATRYPFKAFDFIAAPVR